MSQPYILYPFQFKEMPLTDQALTALGFGEYCDGSGDFGYRYIDLNDSPAIKYKLICQNEKDDYGDGYSYPDPAEYWPSRYLSSDNGSWIYFLHDLYEDIKEKRTEVELNAFIEITKKKGVNMWPYLESYMKYIEQGDLLVHF